MTSSDSETKILSILHVEDDPAFLRLVDKLRRISAPAPDRAPNAPAAAGLPGERIEGEEGVYRICRVDLPLEHTHGRFRLDEVARAAAAGASGVFRAARGKGRYRAGQAVVVA